MNLDERIKKLLEQHVAQIAEHVSAVQIIVTVQNGNESIRYTDGSGCWYSRMGAIREFVVNYDAQIADRVRRLNSEEES
jgi:hypothetical protein